jgi:hypothetical protein
MRRVIALSLLGLCIGCAKPLVIVLPGFNPQVEGSTARAERLPEDCRYTRVAISHAQDSTSMSNEDLEVSAKVAALMRREFANAGATVTDTPADAYWSLMVMAAADDRHYKGFVFSASIGLRDMHEGHDPGITTYESDHSVQSPVVYSGLGFGPGYILEDTIREFARRADVALLPAAKSLCDYAEAEELRESELHAIVRSPL